MCQPRRYGQRHLDKSARVDRAGSEEVKQRTILVVVGYKPQLGPCAVVCKTQL